MPDAIAAVVQYLGQSDELDDLVEGRIFAESVPDSEVDEWAPGEARACVVVQSSAGGYGALQRTFVRAGNSRFDIRCYGPTPEVCNAIYGAAYPHFKQLTRQVVDDCLVYDITPVIEKSMLREPDTDFWFAFASFNVMAAEIAVAS
jgi:hypothetical protein